METPTYKYLRSVQVCHTHLLIFPNGEANFTQQPSSYARPNTHERMRHTPNPPRILPSALWLMQSITLEMLRTHKIDVRVQCAFACVCAHKDALRIEMNYFRVKLQEKSTLTKYNLDIDSNTKPADRNGRETTRGIHASCAARFVLDGTKARAT